MTTRPAGDAGPFALFNLMRDFSELHHYCKSAYKLSPECGLNGVSGWDRNQGAPAVLFGLRHPDIDGLGLSGFEPRCEDNPHGAEFIGEQVAYTHAMEPAAGCENALSWIEERERRFETGEYPIREGDTLERRMVTLAGRAWAMVPEPDRGVVAGVLRPLIVARLEWVVGGDFDGTAYPAGFLDTFADDALPAVSAQLGADELWFLFVRAKLSGTDRVTEYPDEPSDNTTEARRMCGMWDCPSCRDEAEHRHVKVDEYGTKWTRYLRHPMRPWAHCDGCPESAPVAALLWPCEASAEVLRQMMCAAAGTDPAAAGPIPKPKPRRVLDAEERGWVEAARAAGFTSKQAIAEHTGIDPARVEVFQRRIRAAACRSK